jgi:hypothetical protein
MADDKHTKSSKRTLDELLTRRNSLTKRADRVRAVRVEELVVSENGKQSTARMRYPSRIRCELPALLAAQRTRRFCPP